MSDPITAILMEKIEATPPEKAVLIKYEGDLALKIFKLLHSVGMTHEEGMDYLRIITRLGELSLIQKQAIKNN